MPDENPIPVEYRIETHLETDMRESVLAVAQNLRRVADDIERISKQPDLGNMPRDTLNKVIWGVANSGVDRPAQVASEMARATDMLRKKDD